MSADSSAAPTHFIQDIVEADNAAAKWGTWPGTRTPRVHTRFPPEPNGYLHIGHAKSICLNYGLADRYDGRFNLRFDDTNPLTEETEYVESIVGDVRWLGAKWTGMRDDEVMAGVLFASDYFDKMYDWAVDLVKKGKAYVCDLVGAQVTEYRGTLTSPGRNSPCRDRSPAENLDLLEQMRKGAFPDGSKTLRAKIDMASPNLNLRDPIMYRIVHAPHHRTGDKWCIYPSYDWAHGLEDSIEEITHSICTLEFENHRPLYDWFIDAINEGNPKPIHHPQQIEFARGELNYTVMSKRRLLELVKTNRVRGWDDPRMPTLAGFRRRGYTAEAIRAFWGEVGVAKYHGVIEVVRLENALRDQLNRTAPRRMAVLRPLKLVITNWADGGEADRVEWLDAVNNPEDASLGTRKVPFSGTLYVEREDFMETPAPKYWRLYPGNEVRLRWGFFVRCTGCKKDAAGEVTEIHCTYDPATRGGDAPDNRKVKATLHWVSASHAVDAEVRLYDHLFMKEDPSDVPEGADWKDNLNPKSLEVLTGCKLEPSLADAEVRRNPFSTIEPDRIQFERHGYFCVDPDSDPSGPSPRKIVFNRAVSLKDTWAKVGKKG